MDNMCNQDLYSYEEYYIKNSLRQNPHIIIANLNIIETNL